MLQCVRAVQIIKNKADDDNAIITQTTSNRVNFEEHFSFYTWSLQRNLEKPSNKQQQRELTNRIAFNSLNIVHFCFLFKWNAFGVQMLCEKKA